MPLRMSDPSYLPIALKGLLSPCKNSPLPSCPASSGLERRLLLNYVLNNRHGLKVAVIVNDMSEVNIDADLVRDGGANLSRTDEKLVEMTNGCICCTLRDDLLREVRALAESGRFDYLLIESTGISEPLPVAATFDFRSEHGESLSDVARPDTMLTVVDAMNLLKDYSSTDFLQDRGEALEGDRRTLVDLLVEQIEFADVVVLNKVDDASEEQRDAARKIIRSLNPEADIIEANHSRVPFDRVLDTGRFNFEKAQQHPLWYKELYGFAEHVPESEEYGVKNFVYCARRPFDPVKFDQFVKEPWPGVIRAKGHFWLATRPRWLGEISQAGSIVRTEALGFWWAAVPVERWPDDPFWRKNLRKHWNEIYGDRRQEIVFIGTGMDEASIRARLDACLVPGRPAMDVAEWAKLVDPFPIWQRADQAA
jgi:G3E family GTPase